MLLKTLLNHVEKHKSFVYKKSRLIKGKTSTSSESEIEILIEPRKNSYARCSGCGQSRPGYDRLPQRRFDYVPLWGMAVVFLYAMRRVDCPLCGVTVEEVPWARGKSPLTKSFSRFLAVWARRLSWGEVAFVFKTTWNRVYDAVEWVVLYGLENQDLTDITVIGIDELAYKKGHKYLTLVYQLDPGKRRLLWLGKDRKETTLRNFFLWFGEKRSKALRFVCSDMWKPYLNVIRECAKGTLHILDRFHIMANLNKALDEVRRNEANRLKEEGKEPILKHSRWCILKRVENLTKKQFTKLRELLAYNLTTMKAYLVKEDFQQFWEYTYAANAGKFLDAWCLRTMRSKMEPMKKIARSLREHRELILNWFKAKKEFSSAAVEGLNNKVKTTIKKSYGFKTDEVLEIALYHTLGDLPLPPTTHEF